MRRVALLIGMLTACGPKPEERYLRALNYKADGNAKAYFDELLKVASDAPESRAGRRARAMLQGPDLMTLAAVGGVLSAVAIPNFMKFQARAKESGHQQVSQELHGLFIAQKSYYAEFNRYGHTFADIGFAPAPGSRFVFFLTPQEAVVGSGVEGQKARQVAARALSDRGITPRATQQGFLAAAVGNLDGDAQLEVWTIDQSGAPVNLASDDD